MLSRYRRALDATASAATLSAVFAVLPCAHASPIALEPLVLDGVVEVVQEPLPGVFELAVDLNALAVGATAPQLHIRNFPLDAKTSADFDLEPFTVFTRDARIVADAGITQEVVPPPSVALYTGTLVGDPDSHVFLAISDRGINGFVRDPRGGENYIISSGRNDSQPTVIYAPDRLAESTLKLSLPSCGAESLPEYAAALEQIGRPTSQATERGGSSAILPRRLATIAIDTDNEFAGMFATTQACENYVATLFGAVSSIYRRELNIDLKIGYLRVATQPDPWTESAAQAQLSQFRLNWLANNAGVSRNAAHLLSARALTGAGGTAYLNGLCSDLGFGLSSYLNGFFPSPLQDNQPQNWDVYVVAHELGHNFGAPHTHQMSPPIDQCGNGDCSSAAAGTIMSYCHTCVGGLANIAFNFHPRIMEERMLPFLANVSCNLTAPAVCLADLDENGRVDGMDLSVLLTRFFTSTPGPQTGGDLNGDAFINGADLSVFLRVFGQNCP